MSIFQLFTMRGLAPHGYCLLWDPALIWLHVVSDAIIGLSYFSIPIALTVFLSRRRDIEFGWLLWLFAIFIMACGSTHFMSILTLWVPAYGLEGLVKAFTAAASVTTAIMLWPLLPKLIAIPSPSELQRANTELRIQTEERMRIEEQLHQARKLEAIGQLTAGIAHDFNNLLAVIMGSVDRAVRFSDDGARLMPALESAMEASQRAAKLTDQLLTFGRRRAMSVDRHDLNEAIRDISSLLHPTVGSQIELSFDLADAPLLADVDRTQLETAILNLVANARDATPAGGAVVVASRAIGDREVALSITDHGTGMDAATIERATEPFFTTKQVGQGTGLGLSQVYGFAQQAGGRLEIASRLGHGTTVTIVLPAAESR